MKYKLIILNLVVLAGICIVFFSTQVSGTCDSGINKNHLDKTARAFVDNETLEINDANGVQIKPAYINGKVGSGNVSPSTYAGEQNVTLPNGLILKFGKTTNPTGNHIGGIMSTTVNFGTAFPNAILSINVTMRDDNAQGDTFGAVSNISTSGFTINIRETTPSSQNMQGCYWMALGY